MHAWESIQKSVDYIENNIGHEIRLDKLAEIANLSYFYFHRLFKRLVKKPVQEYIKLRRLARACDALSDKNQRILDVALAYGFCSHETFTRAFKEAYGFTPAEYRNNPIQLKNFIKPDLLLGYVFIDEGVPLITSGMVLEINRKTLDKSVKFIGMSDHVQIDGQNAGGKVTGVDGPGVIWGRFHESNIICKPGGRNIGVSYGGDAPAGCFTYFVGTEAFPDNECEMYKTWELPPTEYIVCKFEAESFEALVTDAIYKAGDYTFSWLKRHGVRCDNFVAELYFTDIDVACMEMWYPVKEE